jgi:hypothetical protein
MHPAFEHNLYLLHRQVLALTGNFRLYDPNRQLVLFSQQKMFRLKEDIRAYSDESRSEEILYIQARQIIDFSAAYDVYDSQEKNRVGVLRRKGFNSLVRDEWELLDARERYLGTIVEDNLTNAILRRMLLGRLLPQSYQVLVGGKLVAIFKQRFNLLRYELILDFKLDPACEIDRRLGIAAGILLATIEGRQD